MKRILGSFAAAGLALILTVPAFAGSTCGMKSSATSATAWGGAWVQRTPSGSLVVTDVAKGSPASRSGLKAGDVVLAVNGYELASNEQRAICASKADCRVGSTVAYKVRRGTETRAFKFKLEKMPANTAERMGGRYAFDPTLAAVVSTTNN